MEEIATAILGSPRRPPTVASHGSVVATQRSITRPHRDQPSRGSVPTFSVVIPTLEEAALIGGAVAALRQDARVVEVIVADGGSHDATCALARAAGARVVPSAAGRGVQMNAGARVAEATVLAFVHADCRLPPGAFDAMCAVLSRGDDAGVFAIDYRSPHPLLRLVSLLSHLRGPWTEFGEAALFVRRTRFESLGGFPPWPLFEDVDLLARLRRARTLGRARGEVAVSPRRYLQRGVLRQQAWNVLLLALFRLGFAPERLQKWYEGCSPAFRRRAECAVPPG